MSAQPHTVPLPMDVIRLPIPINRDTAQPLVVVLVVPETSMTTSTGPLDAAERELDEEPTWEDAEWQ